MNKVERKAASATCYMLFSLCGTLHHAIRQVISTGPPSGVGMGNGLTEKEREYMRGIATDVHKTGERLRLLGHRFNKS